MDEVAMRNGDVLLCNGKGITAKWKSGIVKWRGVTVKWQRCHCEMKMNPCDMEVLLRSANGITATWIFVKCEKERWYCELTKVPLRNGEASVRHVWVLLRNAIGAIVRWRGVSARWRGVTAK